MPNVYFFKVTKLILEPAISASASASATPTPAPKSGSSSGLSVGAIAGIAASVFVILAALLIALAFFLKKNRDKVRLDSDSDIPPPIDGEKTTLKVSTHRRSLSTTDSTHFDVPLAFAPGSAPGTPRSTTSEFPRVPVEAVKTYVGPPPRSVGQPGAMEHNIPPGSPIPEMRQQYPTSAGQVPPSPKFPIQSNGVLLAGWQNTPAQRSQQQGPPARDQSQSVQGQPRGMRPEQGPPQQFRNDIAPQPYRGGGPPPSPRGERPPQAYRGEGPPQSPRRERPPQGYRREGPPQSRSERPPQAYRSDGPPQSPRSGRPPQGYREGPPQANRNNAALPQIPRKQLGPSQQLPDPPQQISDPSTQSQSARNPPVQAQQPRTPPGQPQPAQPVPFEAQPPSTFVRQNSRRGLIPPFPVDAVTRKPIANRSPTTPLPPSRESEPDIPSDSDETPPPTKVSPITTNQVPIVRVTEVQRDESVKSVKGTIEDLTRSISPPPTPPVIVSNAAMGTGFVGKEEPSRAPPQVIVPQVSMTPPAPQVAQFPRKVVAPLSKHEGEPSRAPAEIIVPQVSMTPPTPQLAKFPRKVVAPLSKREGGPSEDSVTADFLRSSVTDTESGSTRTSMVVEGSSTAEGETPSRTASSVFEMEATPPLVIAKVEDKKADKVETKEVKKSYNEEIESEEMMEMPPTLPALERGSVFSFGDLT